MTRVVVIGAGFGGLSAAIELAKNGIEVKVLDPKKEAGGKVDLFEDEKKNKYDCGPTVVTLKEVFSELFEKSNEKLEDYVTFKKLGIVARHSWSDKEVLDLHSDADRNFEAISKFSGISEARNFNEFSKLASELHKSLENSYMKCQRPSMLKLIKTIGFSGSKLLIKAGLFNSLWEKLEKQFSDIRLRQLFGRYATYCGSSPWQAPSTLMLIWDVEMRGVWSVEGGVINLARAMRKLAEKNGATFFNNSCEEILSYDGKITGVRLNNDNHILADRIVFNGDYSDLNSYLLNNNIKDKRHYQIEKNRSLSAITWMTKNKTSGFKLSRHNVFFNSQYQKEFSDIFKKGIIPTNPTVYLCAQDRLDDHVSSLSEEERLFLLINAPPNGDFATITETEMEKCQASVFALLNKCGLQIEGAQPRFSKQTPKDFHLKFPGTGGALYGRPTHGWLSPFMRPSARSKISGLYLSGGTVHPGPGLPMATISGQLAAEALMEDLGLTKR